MHVFKCVSRNEIVWESGLGVSIYIPRMAKGNCVVETWENIHTTAIHYTDIAARSLISGCPRVYENSIHE